MRFKRRDLVGIVIATLAPVGLLVMFLASYQLWDHHGSPILAIMATNLAVGGGIIGAFSRYIRNWDLVGGLAILLAICIVSVIVIQKNDADGTAVATSLKLLGVLAFSLLNLAVIGQFLKYGIEPILLRREDRRSKQATS